MGATQLAVRDTMRRAGGYWRPLAAVARLLEELGELAELLALPAPDAGELAGELADLWIITTALADQFLAEVLEPGECAGPPRDGLALLIAAGPIARVVNHYDGPKTPRGELPSLTGAVAAFHAALAGVAAAREIDLGAAVTAKIELIHARGDIERFGPQGFDPSTAPVLERVEAGRLWGAPEPPGEATIARLSRSALPTLTMFAKAARAERLEGLVIAGPPAAGSIAGRAAWLGALVAALDPCGAPGGFELAGVRLRARTLVGLDGRLCALIAAA